MDEYMYMIVHITEFVRIVITLRDTRLDGLAGNLRVAHPMCSYMNRLTPE